MKNGAGVLLRIGARAGGGPTRRASAGPGQLPAAPGSLLRAGPRGGARRGGQTRPEPEPPPGAGAGEGRALAQEPHPRPDHGLREAETGLRACSGEPPPPACEAATGFVLPLTKCNSAIPPASLLLRPWQTNESERRIHLGFARARGDAEARFRQRAQGRKPPGEAEAPAGLERAWGRASGVSEELSPEHRRPGVGRAFSTLLFRNNQRDDGTQREGSFQ